MVYFLCNYLLFWLIATIHQIIFILAHSYLYLIFVQRIYYFCRITTDGCWCSRISYRYVTSPPERSEYVLSFPFRHASGLSDNHHHPSLRLLRGWSPYEAYFHSLKEPLPKCKSSEGSPTMEGNQTAKFPLLSMEFHHWINQYSIVTCK